MAGYQFTPAQEAVANAVAAHHHVDGSVVDIAKEKNATVRRREARDLWDRILSTPNHAYHHPAAAGHLLAVDSMRYLGELAFEND